LEIAELFSVHLFFVELCFALRVAFAVTAADVLGTAGDAVGVLTRVAVVFQQAAETEEPRGKLHIFKKSRRNSVLLRARWVYTDASRSELGVQAASEPFDVTLGLF
jgi:hypothetical protein